MKNATEQLSKLPLVEMLEVSSVHLLKLDAQNTPAGGMASALLIDYKGLRYVCTVAHALADGPLSMQLEWSPERRATATRQLNLRQPDTGEENLDFAFCSIRFKEVPLFQDLDNENLSGNVQCARECKIYNEDDIGTPSLGGVYGFFGQTKQKEERHVVLPQDVKYIHTTGRPGWPIIFSGEEAGCYIFDVPGGIPDKEYLEGCSGAPIIDANGKVVALVKGGNSERSIVRGVPISRVLSILDEDIQKNSA